MHMHDVLVMRGRVCGFDRCFHFQAIVVAQREQLGCIAANAAPNAEVHAQIEQLHGRKRQ